MRTFLFVILLPILLVVLPLSQAISLAADEKVPWPADVERFVAPAANEHPRLFFRKKDVEELRRRANTPDGQAIVARLKKLLGGGEQMPTHYSTATKAYANLKEDLPLGSYTLWHASGFGMLYQLTGEQKYADLAQQCVQKAFDGQRDRDDRYSWVAPGGFLRAGPSLGAIAMAYDLNFDGWDPDFRRGVVEKFLSYTQGTTRDGGGVITLDKMCLTPRLKPSSNHYGCQVGGAGLVLLAIRGDDGANDPETAKRVEKLLDANHRNTVRALTEGFGDGGYFWEHPGPGQIASDTAFTPYLQAMKIAGGKDYITPRPNAQWMTLRWVMELVPNSDGQPYYPNRHPSSYGTEFFERVGLSRGGQFAQGFGAVDARYKPALLWSYQHVVEPGEPKLAIPGRKEKEPDGWLEKGEHSYDAILYPHRASLALVNWPIDIEAKNPDEVLPHAMCDSIRQYYAFRNRWKDADDILVTALMGAQSKGKAEPIVIWGLGMKTTFPISLSQAKADYFKAEKDGSAVVGVPIGGDKHYSFAIDMSGRSGAPLMIIMAGGPVPRSPGVVKGKHDVTSVTTVVKAGETTYTVLTLQSGQAPLPVAEQSSVRVGAQRVTFDGSKLVLEEIKD